MNLKKLLNGISIIGYSAPLPNTGLTLTPTTKDEEQKADSLMFFYKKLTSNTKKLDLKSINGFPYAVVTDTDTEIINNERALPIIYVENAREALAYAYSNYYEIDYDKLKIIGITGTNGKTTTATLIFEILKHAGYKVSFIGTGKICINDATITESTYSMTTPDPDLLYSSLAKMQSKCDYLVMEVSSHAISLGKVSPIKFEYGILTNISEEHMDFHSSMEEYRECKMKVLKMSRRGVYNSDDALSRTYNNISSLNNIDRIGIIQNEKTYATDIETSIFGSNFYYRDNGLIFKVKTRLPGHFNVYNSMLALKCVIDLGIKPCIAKKCIEGVDKIDGRMNVIRSDITVIIDYAHTPFAFLNCIKTIKSMIVFRQKLIVVFGCGGNRDKGKRSKIGSIVAKYADKIILTEDNNRNEKFYNIISDISQGLEGAEHVVIKDRSTAIKHAISSADTGDIVAIIGKGHERYMIENNTIIPYDEQKIINEALNDRRAKLCELN